MTIMDNEIRIISKITTENLKKYSNIESRRLFHGRGDSIKDFHFINIDLFPPALLITIYEERDEVWKESLASELYKLDGIDVVVFQSRVSAPWNNEILRGQLPEFHIIEENGLKYSVSLSKGENPGIFPDMREGRKYLVEICSGKKVLNLFSYTCAFSVAAAHGGAESILNMDMNSNSLNKGRLNHQLNGNECEQVSYLSHNILKSFGKITKRGPYNLVVIDPPPSQGSSFNLVRDYGKILRKSKEFLTENGEIFACLNSHTHDFEWFKNFLLQNLDDFIIVKELGAGTDFPEIYPEKGLKILHLLLK